MKKIYFAFIMVLSFVLIGCNKDDTNAPNRDISQSEAVQKELNNPEQLDQLYGQVVHHGKVANVVKMQGVKMSPDMMAVNIVVPDKQDPMILSFLCDRRIGGWALSHSLNKDGMKPEGVTEISIMNYREGLTDIREGDEAAPIWSTANGDTNIAVGLMRIARLDPKSTVAIVLDRQKEDGYYDGEVWSYLLPVSQVASELKLIDLSICTKSPLPADESPEIIYTSIEEIRAAARKTKI